MTLRSRVPPVILAALVTLAACSGGSANSSSGSTSDASPESESGAAAGATSSPSSAESDADGTTDSASQAPSSSATPGPDVDTALFEAYKETPNLHTATPLIDAFAASGDVRWVPWLLDLYRVILSNLSDIQIVEALASLTGVERIGTRIDDFQQYGEWSQTNDIDPGPGYRDWKLTLYGQLSDLYGVLLAGVEDLRVLRDIHWGGVFRGGIPELNEPERVGVDEADWMVPDEVVVVAELGDQAVAYPERIVGRHELVNDVIDGVPVAMVYCTLCRSGLLFDRRLDTGEELTFQTSGLLHDSNKIMIDNETDTLWFHLTGVGFAGAHNGYELDQYPLVTTTWADFVADHPGGQTLVIPDPIFFPDNPDRPPIAYDYEPDAAYKLYYSRDNPWFPIDTPDGRQDLKDEVIGVSLDGHQLALPVEALVALDAPVEIPVGDRTVTVTPTGAGATVEDEDGNRLIAPQMFWFAWYGLHPETEVWSP